MATDNERVEYQFTGDVSSLAKATKQAIDYLSKYEDTVKAMTRAGQFEVNRTAYSSFNRAINSITTQVNSLVTSLNKSSGMLQKVLSPDTSSVVRAGADIRRVFETLQWSSTITTKDIKELTAQLKNAQNTMAAVADKAAILSSDFKQLNNLEMPMSDNRATKMMQTFSQETQKAAVVTENSMSRIIKAFMTTKQIMVSNPLSTFAQDIAVTSSYISNYTVSAVNALSYAYIEHFSTQLDHMRDKVGNTVANINEQFARLATVFGPTIAALITLTSTMQSMKDKSTNALNQVTQASIETSGGFLQLGEQADDAAASCNALAAAITNIKIALGAVGAISGATGAAGSMLGSTSSVSGLLGSGSTALVSTLSNNSSALTSTLGTLNMSTSAHTGLANSIRSLTDVVKLDTFEFLNEGKTLKNKNNILKTSSTLHKGLSRVIAVLRTKVEAETKKLKKYADTIKGLFSSIGNAINNLTPSTSNTNIFNNLLSASTIADLGQAFSEAVKESISYVENLNLFTVAMGESIDTASQFINKMSEIYGMDPSNLYRYSGYFYQLTDAVGTASKASEVMSLSLTKASNDIASLFNVQVETAVDNLSAGIQGMSRAVRKYGIDIRVATLQQTALNYGFTENISTTSEANRQALRYLTIMQQIKSATQQVTTATDGSTVAMGDFARNIETPANQLRILKEQATIVARAFGNFFIPIMQRVLYVINGVMMALAALLQFLAALVGIDVSGFGGSISAGAEEATGAVDDIGDAADGAADKLKKLIAPFDELTILTEPTSGGGGGGGGGGAGGDMLDPGLLAALEEMQLALDDVRMKALDVRDKILDLLGLKFDEDGNIVRVMNGFIDELVHLWELGRYEQLGSRVARFINKGIAWGIEHTDPKKYGPLINKKIETAMRILNGFVEMLNWEGLGTILGNGITIALGALNTALANFRWLELGRALAQYLNGVINAIDWPLLGETIANSFNAIIYYIKGVITDFDWVALGLDLGAGFMQFVQSVDIDSAMETLALLVNSLVESIGAFLSKYEWGTIGKKLAHGLNLAIHTIKWGDIGDTVAEVATGILEELITFLSEFDFEELMGGLATIVNKIFEKIGEFADKYEWGTIGKKLAKGFMKAVREINWTNVGATTGKVLRGLLKEIKEFVGEMDWDEVVDAVFDFLDGLEWDSLWSEFVDLVYQVLSEVMFQRLHILWESAKAIGKNIVEGMLAGILAPILGIGGWLWDNLCKPVINAVKGWFGIQSPSTVFKEIGGFLIEGLLNGILDALSNIGSWIKEHITDPIINAIKKFFGIEGNSSSEAKSQGTAIANGFTAGLNTVQSGLDSFSSTVTTKVSNAMVSANSAMASGLSSMEQKVAQSVSKMSSEFGRVGLQLQSILEQSKTIPSVSTNTSSSSSSSWYTSTSATSSLKAGSKKPLMASGGVVRGPTDAIIGEGRYSEAVIPLGNSPELQEMIDKIANAVSTIPARDSGNNNQSIEVHVYIDGSEITTSQNSVNRMYGRTQQNI